MVFYLYVENDVGQLVGVTLFWGLFIYQLFMVFSELMIIEVIMVLLDID